MENTTLNESVEIDAPLKEGLVDYVGNQAKPDDGRVTVEMIVQTIATEFPEFLMVVAEENWDRGYHQALADVEIGQAMAEEQEQNDNTGQSD